jgi:hypothetical protein
MTTHATPVPLTLTLSTAGMPAASARVRWESPVLGVQHSRFVSPYRGASLALMLRALNLAQSLEDPHASLSAAEQAQLATLGLWNPAGWVPPDACQRVGRALYQALVADPRGAQAMQSVRSYAAAQGHSLALSLRLPPAAHDLAALPWELLWDGGPVPLLLSRGRVAACTRYLDLDYAPPPPRPYRLPLRVLALAPQAGIAPRLRNEERAARRAAWQPLLQSGYLEVDELEPATPQALVDALQTRPRPDVVHFYGHGRYTAGQGALLLDAPEGGGRWVTADALMALLGGVRMVALFACQGAAVSGDGSAADMLAGVAPALSAAGVPIVMGMQVAVRVQAATRASGVMYRALVAGWSVQQAVGLARQALYVEEADRASWYVPVLYVRAHDTAPLYLLAPPPQRAAATQAGATLPRQSVSASGSSQVRGVAMQQDGSATQAVGATRASQVGQARLRAVGEGEQRAWADDNSTIRDIELEQE